MSPTIKSFFDKQKRDLSDKSNEDDEKRRWESSLNTSLSKNNTDIFEQGTELPRCAGILCSCLQNLVKKVNEIPELSSTMKEAQIKGARYMEEVNESIQFINDKFEEMEAARKEKEQQNEKGDTDEVIIGLFEKEMEEKLSANIRLR